MFEKEHIQRLSDWSMDGWIDQSIISFTVLYCIDSGEIAPSVEC